MATTPQTGPWTRYKQIVSIKPHVDRGEIPIEEQRVAHAIGVNFVKAAPYKGAIASVGQFEPHNIEINNPEEFNKGQAQTKAHEITHLWSANLPSKMISQIPPDNPKNPYDISNIDQLRKQGKTLSTIPREMAGTILQLYTADPSQRARLQPWIDDMNTTPLSIFYPTGPNDKKLNMTVRPPVAPIEAWKDEAKQNLAQLWEEANKRDPRAQRRGVSQKRAMLPVQPKRNLPKSQGGMQ